MKYLKLPLHLIKFWYLESLIVILRAWKNILFYLEEDLAVGLMLKLLFTPLFHDASIGGRMLSFGFRSFRIGVGVTAFFLSTLLIFSLALCWFLLPALVVIYPQGLLGWVIRIALFSGLVLFINHIISHPHKTVKALKNAGEIWQASLLKKKDLNFNKLCATPEVANLLSYLEIGVGQLVDLVKINEQNLDQILAKTLELGQKLQVSYLGPEHFLVGILAATPNVDEQLLKLNLKIDDFIDALGFLERKRQLWRTVFIWDRDFHIKHLKGINRGWLGVPTPNLDLVSEDLTRKAAREKLADFVGRKEEVGRVINILSQNTGRNVVIVGQPGSGRDALVEYLAKLIIAGDAPLSLATKRLVRLDGVKLLAGTENQGDLAEKIKNIFEEVKYSGNIIVYIEEIQNISDLYSLLLPYIEAADFQFVTVTDEGSYTRVLEKNQSFAHLFIKVELPPASVSDTIAILKNKAVEYERDKKI
ncbi:hypothetical protein HY385_02295, partial [Candidatus Daviesbacteria bacterium]|nr:hypothetical protein [Candidatus Daviesbacteria bacterium]